MRIVSIIILIVALVTSIYGQNLFLNSSFETPGSGSAPTYWEYLFFGSLHNGDALYITTGGGNTGSCYVQNKVTATYSSGNLPYWTHSSTNYELEPNCLYRLSYYFRRSTGADRGVALITAGGSWVGTDVLDMPSYPNPPVATWTYNELQFSTAPDGYEDLSFGLLFGIDDAVFQTLQIGDTLDYDDIQIQLLERKKIATLYIPVLSSPRTYDYSNTDVKITFTSNSQAGNHTVEKKDGTAPEITWQSLAKYWVINNLPGAFSASPAFSYTDGELSSAGLSETNITLARKPDAGSWARVNATVNTAENTITPQEPVTSFSTWAIVEGTTAVSHWFLY